MLSAIFDGEGVLILTEREIKDMANSVVRPDSNYILLQQNRLLRALLYLVDAEAGGTVDDPLPRCREVLRETMEKAERRSTKRVPGNPLWILLSRFREARMNCTLSSDAWALWLEASRVPDDLGRAISGLRVLLDMMLAA